MAEVAQTYLGNINHNADLAHSIETKSYLELTLKPEDRQKGRIHAHTASGVEIGIIKSRDRSLESGDLFETDSGKILLINLQETELLLLDLSKVDSNITLSKLVELGHTLGNHHYPLKVEGNLIHVRLNTDKLTAESLIKSLNIDGLQIRY